MQRGELLDGTWEFIGKEVYLLSAKEWVNHEDYVEGMRWQFCLNFAANRYEQGVIIETSPNGERVEMEYIYNNERQRLTVDIEIQDIYKVIPSLYNTSLNSIIRLKLLSDDASASSMRYILRRVNN
ncbi:MAG: hypothetical protein SNJ33_02035 [Rikenellaceae bacterium]